MPNSNSTILPGIDHIVVLMLENRSFDNVLGWLYDRENAPPFHEVPPGQTFDGVSCKGLTNPFGDDGQKVPVGSTTDTTNPCPDPGEVYADIYQQLYNLTSPPAQVPPEPPQPPPMTGFVNNYAAQPKVTTPSNIMNGFRPPSLPSLTRLAYEYVVCDRWFASVPSQTMTNRSFVHAGTASGFVNNDIHPLHLLPSVTVPFFINDTPTIFNLLEEQRISWRIYYGGLWFFCMAFLGQGQLERYMFDHWPFGPRRMYPLEVKGEADETSFLDDVKFGRLPAYSFLEPNFADSLTYGRENTMHPDAGISDRLDFEGPSDARYGDELVRKVYQALKNGPRDQWESTLLVIVFDEHGGCYDHVPPGPAVPPDDRSIPPGQDGYSGFRFDRYGVRVPAVLVSPRLTPHTVDHTLYDHTSILRTIMDRFGVQGDLGARAAAANPLNLALGEPRSDDPDLSAPVVSDEKPSQDMPLSSFQAGMARTAHLRLLKLGQDLRPEVGKAEAPPLHTELQTETELQRLAALLPRPKSQ